MFIDPKTARKRDQMLVLSSFSPLMSKYGFGKAKIPFAGHNHKHTVVCETEKQKGKTVGLHQMLFLQIKVFANQSWFASGVIFGNQ